MPLITRIFWRLTDRGREEVGEKNPWNNGLSWLTKMALIIGISFAVGFVLGPGSDPSGYAEESELPKIGVEAPATPASDHPTLGGDAPEGYTPAGRDVTEEDCMDFLDEEWEEIG